MSFVRSPSSVGSIAPSSRHLVASMMAAIDWNETRTIAELGAGTGVMTAAIDRLRRRDSQFYCFEKDIAMRDELAAKYPDATFRSDAFTLEDTLASLNVRGLDCVVSGLPFANFGPKRSRQLLDGIHSVLNPGGLFVAFQYSWQLHRYLKKEYDAYRCRVVWLNVPPALVYVCRKAS